jgi:hypothetical protein
MIPVKEKAIQLVNSFDELGRDFTRGVSMKEFSKQCALLAVEEMLGEYQSMSDLESVLVINNKLTFIVHQLQYWMEVKQNIQKL